MYIIKYIYNNKIFRERRRGLRNNQTKTEKILWKYLGNQQLKGRRFFRQYSVGPYIIDFYCPKARLAIELDGETHMSRDEKLYDIERTKYLNGNDIKVIRFWNGDIENNLKSVLEKIVKAIQ